MTIRRRKFIEGLWESESLIRHVVRAEIKQGGFAESYHIELYGTGGLLATGGCSFPTVGRAVARVRDTFPGLSRIDLQLLSDTRYSRMPVDVKLKQNGMRP